MDMLIKYTAGTPTGRQEPGDHVQGRGVQRQEKTWGAPSCMVGQLCPEVAACLRRAVESPAGHA